MEDVKELNNHVSRLERLVDLLLLKEGIVAPSMADKDLEFEIISRRAALTGNYREMREYCRAHRAA